ncbi:MAG: hypothetical protein D3M94_10065 [Rhodocyclales bacterium GT-UBC]|nr:MAG: hypothetical protein D3M94_10065 [Rhodocyclales bacterium GT-UBC]
MLQNIIDQPWPFLGMTTIIALLHVGATLRIRRDRKQKARAAVDRRSDPERAKEGRRWTDRKRSK